MFVFGCIWCLFWCLYFVVFCVCIYCTYLLYLFTNKRKIASWIHMEEEKSSIIWSCGHHCGLIGSVMAVSLTAGIAATPDNKSRSWPVLLEHTWLHIDICALCRDLKFGVALHSTILDQTPGCWFSDSARISLRTRLRVFTWCCPAVLLCPWRLKQLPFAAGIRIQFSFLKRQFL